MISFLFIIFLFSKRKGTYQDCLNYHAIYYFFVIYLYHTLKKTNSSLHNSALDCQSICLPVRNVLCTLTYISISSYRSQIKNMGNSNIHSLFFVHSYPLFFFFT